MIRLIRADQRRYMKKPMLYILVLACCALLFFFGNDVAEADYLKGNFFLFFPFVSAFVIPTYLIAMVYGDDLSYDITPAYLGKGMDRKRLIVNKVTGLLLNMIVINVIFFGVFMLRFYKNGVTPARSVLMDGISEMLQVFLLAFGDVCFALIFLYLTMNVVVGIISFLLFRAIGPLLIGAVENAVKINIHSFIYDGLIGDGINAIKMSRFPWQIIVGVLIYIGGAFIITALVFDRKELDL